MKKHSGLADSPFFQSPIEAHSGAEPIAEVVYPAPSVEPPSPATVIPRHHDTELPRSHDTTIERVRKAVREFGKEAATHRFTLAEKRAISNIIHALGNDSLKTSENEIARIAINYLLDDYQQRGSDSVLVNTIKALRE